jgi:hypothetical protein
MDNLLTSVSGTINKAASTQISVRKLPALVLTEKPPVAQEEIDSPPGSFSREYAAFFLFWA